MTALQRRCVLFAALGLASGLPAFGQTLDAPNLVEISPDLVTAGQPDVRALSALGRLGFEAVIYLAPFTVSNAIKQEPQLVREQGIEFLHIPIPFERPREGHFVTLSLALDRLKGRKVLVHCQRNLRASTLVFLHRVIREKVDPELAYESVFSVWSPSGPWRKLVVDQLAKHRIGFEPY